MCACIVSEAAVNARHLVDAIQHTSDAICDKLDVIQSTMIIVIFKRVQIVRRSGYA